MARALFYGQYLHIFPQIIQDGRVCIITSKCQISFYNKNINNRQPERRKIGRQIELSIVLKYHCKGSVFLYFITMRVFKKLKQ